MDGSTKKGPSMKSCFKCLAQKPLSEFYKHKRMADGHLGKCKDCTKADSKENRSRNIDYYRKYDRDRGNRQEPDYQKAYRAKYPRKYAAHMAVGNAIRGGYLIPLGCEVCGEMDMVHAHHDDYLKPLDVRWLCPAHHKQWHERNGEAANG